MSKSYSATDNNDPYFQVQQVPVPLDNMNTALADTAKAIEELNNRPTNFALEAKKSEEYVSSQAAALVGEETGAYVAGMVNQAAQAVDDAAKVGQDAVLAEANHSKLDACNRRCLNCALDLSIALTKIPPQSSTCTIL